LGYYSILAWILLIYDWRKCMKTLGALILSAVMLSSCGFFSTENPVLQDYEKFQAEMMGTYALIKDQDSGARAMAPIWNDVTPIAFSTGGTYTDYPEAGLTTTWTATATGYANVWEITALTTFPASSGISQTNEIYYIHDANVDGLYDTSDYTVADPAAPVADSTYRVSFTTDFLDGTTRDEYILGDALDSNFQFEIMDINGSLDYNTMINGPALDGAYGASGDWASKVYYTHNMKDNQDWFWWGSLKRASVSGERYYRSYDDNGVFVETYLFIESGNGKRIQWDDAVLTEADIQTEETFNRARDILFTAVVRMEIRDGVKSIRAHYSIDTSRKKSESHYEIYVEDGNLTIQ
jgi:hypothetical protein